MLMNDYQKKKSLIPDGNLLELRFEEFEKNPVEEIRRIYENLLKENFETVKPCFEIYFNTLADYLKNKYKVKKSDLESVLKEWAPFMALYGYDVPDDLEEESG